VVGPTLFMAVEDFGGVNEDGSPRKTSDMGRNLYVFRLNDPDRSTDLAGAALLVRGPAARGARRTAGAQACPRRRQVAAAARPLACEEREGWCAWDGGRGSDPTGKQRAASKQAAPGLARQAA
jgi:hypothetical protein